MMAATVGVQGDLTGRRYPVGTRPVTFGRGDENDVVLADTSVSRLHAELRPEAGGYVLCDPGSSNGTLVNGIAITSQQFRSGDQITIGDDDRCCTRCWSATPGTRPTSAERKLTWTGC